MLTKGLLRSVIAIGCFGLALPRSSNTGGYKYLTWQSPTFDPLLFINFPEAYPSAVPARKLPCALFAPAQQNRMINRASLDFFQKTEFTPWFPITLMWWLAAIDMYAITLR